MAKLIYSALMSLDGYIEDQDGNFEWAAPDEQVHTFINDLLRPVGTYLYGRRMYETGAVWETDPALAEMTAYTADFAQIWQAADKVVYSTALEKPVTAKTRIERTFDPEAVRLMKASATRDIAIGGPNLAAHAFKAGLIDECQLFLAPVIVGRGKQALPTECHLKLELLEEHRFDGGMVYLDYKVA